MKAHGPNPTFPVVAIGASAGGMVAIEELLKALNPQTGMAFVIIMHLEANHISTYPKIISKCSPMEVFEAAEGTVIQPNRIYVMAAGVKLTVEDGIFHTTVRTEAPAQNKPIDLFFRSLAVNSEDLAIGVILSGSDGDGSEGCKYIEAAGGQMFVQDPSTAANESMPIKAVHKGCDDFMGTPKELGQKLSLVSARHQGFADAKHSSSS